jgi:hypothetical protein
MGKIIVKDAENQDDANPTIIEPDPKLDADAPGEGEGEPGDGQEIEGEVELVIEGDTQPKEKGQTPRGFLKRINKLNGKVDVANGQADDARQGTAEEREKRIFAEDKAKVLEIALAQARGGGTQAPNSKPNPDDFDNGMYDDAYQAAVDTYTEKRIQDVGQESAVKLQKQALVTAANEVTAQDLAKAQKAHYERAYKLKVKDYDETEDKTIKIFGPGNANYLIKNMDDSEIAFYYFGKNEATAEKYAEMMRKEPIRALLEIGRLTGGIKVKPKSEPAPDPDDELEGGGPSNQEANQLKLNKLRTAAMSGKGMDKLMKFKRLMTEKGIKLR